MKNSISLLNFAISCSFSSVEESVVDAIDAIQAVVPGMPSSSSSNEPAGLEGYGKVRADFIFAANRGRITDLYEFDKTQIGEGTFFEEFCGRASNAGVSGLIIPDLPLEEAYKFSEIVANHSMDLILLVAPTTPLERMKKICLRSKGFTYLVSVTGVTGERSTLEDRVKFLVQKLKQFSPNPVAVGFGISDAKHVSQVRKWGADGAIVGSALVKRISNASDKKAVDEAGDFCRELRKAAG